MGITLLLTQTEPWTKKISKESKPLQQQQKLAQINLFHSFNLLFILLSYQPILVSQLSEKYYNFVIAEDRIFRSSSGGSQIKESSRLEEKAVEQLSRC